MNNYITFDSKKYITTAKTWHPEPIVPQTIRVNLDGNLDVTFGPASLQVFVGEIEAPVSPGSGYGSVSDLRTTLAKKQTLSLTDHYGTAHTVAVQGPVIERSLAPKWDGSSNKVYFKVRLIAKQP